MFGNGWNRWSWWSLPKKMILWFHSSFPFTAWWQLPDCPTLLSRSSPTSLQWDWDKRDTGLGGLGRWHSPVQSSQVHKDIMVHIHCSLLQGESLLSPSSSSSFKCFWTWVACILLKLIMYYCTPAVYVFCIILDSTANSLTQHWTIP